MQKINYAVDFSTRTHHGQVDVGGVELHVDLLVDVGLAVGVEVLADKRHLKKRVCGTSICKKKGRKKVFYFCLFVSKENCSDTHW